MARIPPASHSNPASGATALTRSQLALRIEHDPAGEAVNGEIRTGRRTWTFTSWLGLMSAIQAACAATGPDADETTR